MSDGKERTLAEIVEAIYDLPQPKTFKTVRRSQIPTVTEMGRIGKKLGFTVTKQARHYDGIVDGKRVIYSKQVTVYRM